MDKPAECTCGHKPNLHRIRGQHKLLYVACFRCGRRSAPMPREEDAIREWNAMIDKEKHQLFG